MYIYSFSVFPRGSTELADMLAVGIAIADTREAAWNKAVRKSLVFGEEAEVCGLSKVCLVAELMTTDGYWVW